MELPVLVLPNASGYTASTGAPISLDATGSTPEAAIAALKTAVLAKLNAGGQIRTLTVTDVDGIISAAKKVGESLLFEDWVREVEEYRRQHNIIPDAD